MLVYTMPRKVTALKGGRIKIEDDVEEIFERKVTPYGNGAKMDAQKKHIGRKVFVIILKS